MARAMTQGSAKSMVHRYFADWLEQRAEMVELDRWARGEQEPASSLYVPRHYNKNDEYDDLMGRAPTPWLGLVVTSMAQTAFQDGIRRGDSSDNMQVWETFQQNRWDSLQTKVWRGALNLGISYVKAIPGTIPLTGEKSAVIQGYSALTTAAWYGEVHDEWPMFVIYALPDLTDVTRPGWTVELWDEVACYRFSCEGNGENVEDWSYLTTEPHDLGVVPFVRFTNQTDLDGRHRGEVEPFIPLAKRIDQDTFDRLIVQRFGAWKVRFIAGLQRPKGQSETDYQANLLKLKVNDFLVGTDPEMKFGTLAETQLDGFIAARDADLRDLSAVSQTPPHHMLGLSSNMQAESLAAVRAGLTAKSRERRTNWGEETEQLARLTAKIRGNREEMTAYDMQVRWADMEVRSLSQAADALGKLGAQVGVPTEMLFEMIPNWTDTDVKRAMELVESGGFDALVDEFAKQAQQATAAAAGPAQTSGSTQTSARGKVTKVP